VRRAHRRGRSPRAGVQEVLERVSQLRDILSLAVVARWRWAGPERIAGSASDDEKTFVDVLKLARNYYTHYNPRLESRVARRAAPNLLFVQLQAIIEMSLLRELERTGRHAQITHFKSVVAESDRPA
jgi:hypothetical protein